MILQRSALFFPEQFVNNRNKKALSFTGTCTCRDNEVAAHCRSLDRFLLMKIKRPFNRKFLIGFGTAFKFAEKRTYNTVGNEFAQRFTCFIRAAYVKKRSFGNCTIG